MLRAMLILVLAALGGCEPAWFSNGTNPAVCPVNTLAQGACTADGTVCLYTENTGNTQRPAQIMTCRCAAGAWTCTVGWIVGAGQDAATE